MAPRGTLARVRIAYSVGHVLNDLCASMWFTYLLVYLTFVRQLHPTAGWGTTFGWPGTLCVVGSFPFLFSKPLGSHPSSQEAEFVYYAAFIIIFQFGWASTQISHLSLIPDITPIPHERVELNAMRYACTVASNIIVYTVTWAALGISGADHEAQVGPPDGHVFRDIVLIVVAIGAFFSFIFHLVVRDPSRGGRRESRSRHTDEYIRSLVLDRSHHFVWKDWFKEKGFYLVALLYMFTRLYVNLNQVYISIYIQDTLLLRRESIAIIPLVMYVSGLISSLPIKLAAKHIGTKNMHLLGGALGIGGSLWILFGQMTPTYKDYQIYGVAAVVGAASTTMLLASLAITNELIGGHTTSGAFVFGAMSFMDKMANGIAVIIIQDVHKCNSCIGVRDNYYQNVMVYICGGAAVGGIIFALSLFIINHDSSLNIRNGGGVSTNTRPSDIVDVHSSSPAEYEESIGNYLPTSPLLGPSSSA
ncbi:hypothetical protein HPB50_007262 [Hyalomma asiaticum]|uniref:Uncharacterized protein n=1 Tax=Hyalomma asiaticum TaxID=266040 RepID=A0ACB7SSM8_HYAAI|nr:hypothetical protein HPB50_007262 [Hyalomma asiaticum]